MKLKALAIKTDAKEGNNTDNVASAHHCFALRWGFLWLLQQRITFYSCHHRRVLSKTEINTSKWESENLNILKASLGWTWENKQRFHLLLFVAMIYMTGFCLIFAVYLRRKGRAESKKRSWKSLSTVDKCPFLPFNFPSWSGFSGQEKPHEACYMMETYMPYGYLI